jgi:F-type H+-transporting ATPase subunit b
VLNFLILVWLMKRFLYQPILDAIDAREQRIAAELADAAAKQAEAQQERDAFQRKNAEFDQQRALLLNQATDAARAERERLLDEARQVALALRTQQQDALRNEARHLHQALRHRTQQEVFAIARQALTDLAGTRLEERMVEVFAGRLRDLDEAEKQRLTSALKASLNPVIVRTTFDLLPAQRISTETAIKATLGAETPVQFRTAPDLISGIELTTNGQKVAWSIADYVASLEKGVEELLKAQDSPEEAQAEPEPEEPQTETP